MAKEYSRVQEGSRVQEESGYEIHDIKAPAMQMFDGETIVEFDSGGVEDDFDPGSAFEAQSYDLIQDTDLAIRLDNFTPEEIAAFFSDGDNKTDESNMQLEVRGRERSGASADVTGGLSGASEPRKRASAKADIAGGLSGVSGVRGRASAETDIAGGLSGAFGVRGRASAEADIAGGLSGVSGVRGRASARADSVGGLSGVVSARERSRAHVDITGSPNFANNDSGHVGSYATTGIFLAGSMAEEGASSSHALNISRVEFDYD
ncbi:hypothetical protein PsalMR5_01115 [Piscirickettsia salmonis]|nr:hypothetical protein PsalSR1_01116 [Piscirickettsia salmonis]QGP60393.1 hypothetical protein PsalBI1_03006 [Piscirickettsia salmonis]QGP63266.1 hypothetical protein PsalMR5_01115 [Piscirickettsia salmonis]